jgi:hypothetical protein
MEYWKLNMFSLEKLSKLSTNMNKILDTYIPIVIGSLTLLFLTTAFFKLFGIF